MFIYYNSSFPPLLPTASGSGQSKKKAKHAAAKAVLDIIIHGGGPMANSSPAGPAHTNNTDAMAVAAAEQVSSDL